MGVELRKQLGPGAVVVGPRRAADVQLQLGAPAARNRTGLDHEPVAPVVEPSEPYPLEDLDVVQGREDEARPERTGRTREPLGREDDRDDGDPLDRVPLEVAVAPPLDLQLELLDPGLGAREEERLRLRLSPEDELHLRRLRAADLVDEHPGPDGERDHRDAERREPRLQLGRHHPAFPGSPPERLHEQSPDGGGTRPRRPSRGPRSPSRSRPGRCCRSGPRPTRRRRGASAGRSRSRRGARAAPSPSCRRPGRTARRSSRRSSGRPGRPRRGPARRRDPTRSGRGRGRRPAPRRLRRSRPRTAPRRPRPGSPRGSGGSRGWRAPRGPGPPARPERGSAPGSGPRRGAPSSGPPRPRRPRSRRAPAASGVRPRRTNRARLSRAHSSMQAAVTPRAPPETTTTSP